MKKNTFFAVKNVDNGFLAVLKMLFQWK